MSLFDDRRSDVGLRKKAVTLASVLALIALIVGSLFGDRGMLHLMAQREEAAALRRRVEELKAENARLVAEIASLKTDPRPYERLAREELGLARPGETVFVIRRPSATHP